MATYKTPKKVPTVIVGEEDNTKYLRETPTSVANSRSQGYNQPRPRALKSVAQVALQKA